MPPDFFENIFFRKVTIAHIAFPKFPLLLLLFLQNFKEPLKRQCRKDVKISLAFLSSPSKT